MEKASSGPHQQTNTDCNSLLDELQIIWNDIGESDVEKDVMLLELEKECLEIYKRKVDQANIYRAQLCQTIADSEAEIATICSALGHRPSHFNQNDRSLKKKLKFIIQQLDELRQRKNKRLSQFNEIWEQIQGISTLISHEVDQSEIFLDESDLSLRKLEDLERQLFTLQKEKNDRLRVVLNHLNTLHTLCSVLEIDFKQAASEVHPSFSSPDESKNVSSDSIERLNHSIQRLREVKLQRMRMLQDLATAILEMWFLMDTPAEEQQNFQNVTCNIAASEHEITERNSLSMRFINRVEAEVRRLEGMKASRMKELVFKKRIELNELRRRTHLVEEKEYWAEAGINSMETESRDLSLALEQIESQISIVKDEAFSRKEILERVEKWIAACEEESWLEEYNRDENRYNAGKGTHLILKRAEKARVTVSKIPGILETLTAKVISWESERGTKFIYDGSSLMSMLEEYAILRQEKEHERRRLRDQRRLQGQLNAEQEVAFGSKPSPSKSLSGKKLTGAQTAVHTKRLSAAVAATQLSKLDQLPSFKNTFSDKKPSTGMEEDPKFQYLVADAPEEEKTPRRPFAPIIQPCCILTSPHNITCDAEEENKVPMSSLFSDLKSPLATPKHVTMKFCPEEDALIEEDVSFEERRLALLMTS